MEDPEPIEKSDGVVDSGQERRGACQFSIARGFSFLTDGVYDQLVIRSSPLVMTSGSAAPCSHKAEPPLFCLIGSYTLKCTRRFLVLFPRRMSDSTRAGSLAPLSPSLKAMFA